MARNYFRAFGAEDETVQVALSKQHKAKASAIPVGGLLWNEDVTRSVAATEIAPVITPRFRRLAGAVGSDPETAQIKFRRATFPRLMIPGSTIMHGCFRDGVWLNWAAMCRLKQAWTDMKARCSASRSSLRWHSGYAERGIKVCPRWLESFENFVADMGACPEGLTLERVNNDEGYSPGNCKWATRAEQQRNRRRYKNAKYWFIGGMRYPSKHAAAAALGVTSATVWKRCLSANWPDWRVTQYRR